MDKPDLEVIAEEITPNKVIYKCEFCYDSYKKNGKPRKNAKNIYHSHGNPLKKDNNQVLDRIVHCLGPGKEEFQKKYSGVKIYVTDETKRDGF
jgi:hypothetical protein